MTGPQLEAGGSGIGRQGASGDWVSVLRRYLAAIAVGNLVWEFAQLPLYTIWLEGSPREIAFAALHCTGGDLLIAGAALVTAQLVAATGDWPHDRFAAVAAIAVFGGLGYTVFSEWLNTEIRGSWAYADVMPTLPLIGTGVAPVAQWVVVPLAAFWWSRRPFARSNRYPWPALSGETP